MLLPGKYSEGKKKQSSEKYEVRANLKDFVPEEENNERYQLLNANKSKEQPMLLDFCQCLSVLVFVFHFQFNLYLTEPFFQVLYCLQSGKSNESLQEK